MNIKELLLTDAQIAQAETAWGIGGLDISRDEAICRAQVEKMKREGAVMLAKNQTWPDDPVMDAMIDDIETGDIYAAQSNGWQHCQSAAIAVGFRRVEEIE